MKKNVYLENIKNFYKPIRKKPKNPREKWAKYMNKHFTEEKMAYTHISLNVFGDQRNAN